MVRKRFPIMLSDEERLALLAMARDTDGISGAALVRKLIRREAQCRGIWPPTGSNADSGDQPNDDLGIR